MFFRAIQSAHDTIDIAIEQKGPDALAHVLPQAVSCVARILELGRNKG